MRGRQGRRGRSAGLGQVPRRLTVAVVTFCGLFGVLPPLGAVMRTKLLVMLAVLGVVVAACGGDTEPATTTTTTTPQGVDTTAQPAAEAGALPEGPSALSDTANPELPAPLIDPAEIISGGPPPDGIPPIDDPQFVSVGEADAWLTDGDPVVYLEIGGEVHAYPVQVLIWHEIVNDTVGGVPVAVTYCPLCNSAVSYERIIDGVETTFGTSGRLYASALVMYDRATESLWTHFDGRAVVGVLTGRTLDPLPSPLLAWSEFAAAFPEGLVLDRNATGFDRPYGENPYAGYDNPESTPFLFRGDVDDRARAKQRVVGVEVDGVARAWTLEAISGDAAAATNSNVGDVPVVIVWKAGQVTALETSRIVSGRDVGSVGVFSPIVDGETLTFAADGEQFVDAETGSRWDVTGAAVSGPLAGTRLEQIHHLDTFWFAWSTYRPGTDLIEDPAG